MLKTLSFKLRKVLAIASVSCFLAAVGALFFVLVVQYDIDLSPIGAGAVGIGIGAYIIYHIIMDGKIPTK